MEQQHLASPFRREAEDEVAHLVDDRRLGYRGVETAATDLDVVVSCGPVRLQVRPLSLVFDLWRVELAFAPAKAVPELPGPFSVRGVRRAVELAQDHAYAIRRAEREAEGAGRA